MFTGASYPGSTYPGEYSPGEYSPGVVAVISGTILDEVSESDIAAGGKIIVITLTGDTWVASGATFDAQRQNIIDGFSAASSPTNGWNNEVRDKQGVAGVVRTSDTVVTITLDAQADYNITATETITDTVPATAVVGGMAIVAAPTFTVEVSAAQQISIPSTPVGSGVGIRLENIYAALAGHTAPKASRSEYWLLDKIGKLQGLNLTSGNKSLESHLIALYEDLSGNTYTGTRSAELILRAIENDL